MVERLMRAGAGHERAVLDRCYLTGASLQWRVGGGLLRLQVVDVEGSLLGFRRKPPSIPVAVRGIRMPSRNASQLSFDSCTAKIVQPPSEGPAAWKVWPSGRPSPRMHRRKTRFVLLLRTARKVMHDPVRHLVPLSR